MTIAIVDDDVGMRAAICDLLKSFGYAVGSFASAEEFLGHVTLDEIGCVISDMRMPGMDGIEFQEKLLAQGCRVPVIFVTAFSEEKAKARVIRAGACGFLSKPFEARQMLDCLSTALRTRHATSP